MVSEATRATGYLEGLFEGPMLDSKGIKDKESKIKYLTTLIDCVGNSLGRPIDPGSTLERARGASIQPRSTLEGQLGRQNGPGRPIWS